MKSHKRKTLVEINYIPSPLSLALSTINTYFISGMRAIVYNTMDNAPKTSTSDVMGTLLKTPEKTYKGLVPMSPYTTPSV